MRMTKGLAFFICLVAIMLIFLAMFLYVAIEKQENTLIPVSGCLTALVGITTAYMGIQMANNGVKGHNWRQEMFDSENKMEEKNDGKK